MAVLGLAGCASDTGARDAGAAPSLAAPTSASPLWPDYKPPVPSIAPSPTVNRYHRVDGVSVPAGGLKDVSVKSLLEKDPNLPGLIRAAMSGCPGRGCTLRKPVYRDLTGDGRDELVVAVDEPLSRLTLLRVYWASGRTVRPVLIYWGQLGLTGKTFGRDLVITAIGDDGLITTRYRWNGQLMAAVPPQDEAVAPAETGTGASAGTPVPVPDPRTDNRTDAKTTP
ncbi:hypothetical protein ACH4SK_40250 [Streptomyces inhibens]|uniref:hypothetical protein n=1 Tax=Streptomyces inhibens TaxID=2293571 RepID=UPI0037BAD707